MMARKIAFIELNEGLWKPGTFLRHSSIEPLAIEYIGAIAKAEGYDVKIIQQQYKSDDEILQEIIDFSPQLVGFSVMTYNYFASLSLAKKIKQYNPGILTVFGGYHPSFFPEIVKENAIDFVIIGEGEETFKELLRVLNNPEQGYETIRGIAYFDGKLHINQPRERIKDLDSLPNPLRDFNILKECRISGLNYPPLSKQNSVAQILYSRGCPHNCIFCCSPFLYGKRVYFRSPEKVVDEMQEINEKYGTNYFYFADLSFNLNRKKVIALCQEIKKRKLDVNWFCMCRVNNIDEELLKNMKYAGCSRIGFGIDALLETTLAKVKPGQSITMRKSYKALELANAMGIIVRTFIIIGYPWETKEDLENAKEILKTLPIDELRIGLLTPLPGSVIYEEFKKQNLILTDDFSKYTTEEYIIKNPDFSPEAMTEFREKIFREFYQSKEYEKRKNEKIKKFPYLKQSYDEFFEFLNEKGIIK
jgi:anaerobic magnesium-protoporphyrin IX monomethyl ester cyclase